MASLAVFPIPLKQKPLHGSRESHERVREQARVQMDGRARSKPVHELLAIAENAGFCRLPVPSAQDMFVDLEGDPFVGSCGQEYLFGFVASVQEQGLTYEKRWALTPEQEKLGFEWLVGEIIRRWEIDPAMHVYHFGSYETAAFKRLMGAYATREDEIDLRHTHARRVHETFLPTELYLPPQTDPPAFSHLAGAEERVRSIGAASQPPSWQDSGSSSVSTYFVRQQMSNTLGRTKHLQSIDGGCRRRF